MAILIILINLILTLGVYRYCLPDVVTTHLSFDAFFLGMLVVLIIRELIDVQKNTKKRGKEND